MRIVEGTPNVRLPQVFDAWETNTTQSQEETNNTFAVMEYIPVDVVGEMWPALNSVSLQHSPASLWDNLGTPAPQNVSPRSYWR